MIAFMTALDKGKSAEIKRLLAKGVDPNLPVRPSAWPIHYAVLRNKKPIVKLLIAAGADLNVQSGKQRILSNGRRTPLHLADYGFKGVIQRFDGFAPPVAA